MSFVLFPQRFSDPASDLRSAKDCFDPGPPMWEANEEPTGLCLVNALHMCGRANVPSNDLSDVLSHRRLETT